MKKYNLVIAKLNNGQYFISLKRELYKYKNYKIVKLFNMSENQCLLTLLLYKNNKNIILGGKVIAKENLNDSVAKNYKKLFYMYNTNKSQLQSTIITNNSTYTYNFD